MKYLSTLLMLAVAFTVNAAEPLSLVLETNDGTQYSVDASGLKMTVADGQLLIGDKSFSLTSLSKMYFSGKMSDIEDVAKAMAQSPVTVYTLSGQSLTFPDMTTARANLSKGIYIVTNGVESYKIAVE